MFYDGVLFCMKNNPKKSDILRIILGGSVLLFTFCSCVQSGMGDYLSNVGKYNVASPRKVHSSTAEVYFLDGEYFLKVPVYYPKTPTHGMFYPVLPYGGWSGPLISGRSQQTLSFDDDKSLHEYYTEPSRTLECNYVFVKLNNEISGFITNSTVGHDSVSSNLPNIIEDSDFDHSRSSLCDVSSSRKYQYIEVPYLNDVREKCTVAHYALMPITCCAYVADVPISVVLTLGYPLFRGVYLLAF